MKRFSNEKTSYCVEVQKKKAFTLAEILLSLTVIGIVAAIALPSLLGNANERAWATQKKAILTRFSQALPLLPSLNGYGTLTGTNRNVENGNSHQDEEISADTAAETFVRDGLSKVLKITNVCSVSRSGNGNSTVFTSSLGDCGFPSEIETMDGSTINLSSIQTLKRFNPSFDTLYNNGNVPYGYTQLDTVVAASETANGESMLIYYNPKCKPDMGETKDYRTQPKLCANIVYDLNGEKGPNTVGKDIGFLSAFYSSEPVVVAPVPYNEDITSITQENAATECKKLDEDARVPNKEELMSLFVNKFLLAGEDSSIRGDYWSSGTLSSGKGWYMAMKGSTGGDDTGKALLDDRSVSKSVRCVKK